MQVIMQSQPLEVEVELFHSAAAAARRHGTDTKAGANSYRLGIEDLAPDLASAVS